MKTRFITFAFISLSLLVVLASCNKPADVTDQYLRSGNSLALTPDGNLVIAGYSTSSTKGYEAILVKVSASTGDTLWTKIYGNPFSDAFYCVKNAHKGGFIASGFSNRASASSPAMLAVITDNNGVAVKTSTYWG